MRHAFEIEIRENAGRQLELRGTILTEGRAASGGRAELFAPGSVEWPAEGIGLAIGHDGPTLCRAQPIRKRDGRLRIRAKATDEIREAVKGGRRFMSVEFFSLAERRTKGGVREILTCVCTRAALVDKPEYDCTIAELRERSDNYEALRRLWL